MLSELKTGQRQVRIWSGANLFPLRLIVACVKLYYNALRQVVRDELINRSAAFLCYNQMSIIGLRHKSNRCSSVVRNNILEPFKVSTAQSNFCGLQF